MITSTIKIAVLSWLQDLLVGYAMCRPWSPRLSRIVDRLQMKLDALREQGVGDAS